MTGAQKRRCLRIAAAAALLLTSWHPCSRSIANRRDARGAFERGDTLRCAIAVGRGLSESLLYGLHYELLQDMAAIHGCEMKVVNIPDTLDFTDSLRTGAFDMVSLRCTEDPQVPEGVCLSWSCDGEHAIAMAQWRTRALKDVNWRLKYLVDTGVFSQMQSTFKVGYNPLKLADEGVRKNHLSPYDSLIRKYAAFLGWDWRMLAALIYKESKFTINNVSPRGAAGLMQVMPSTAAGYGIEDLMNPEENIKAGTMLLKRIQDRYFAEGFSESEKENFTLAAYNAGVGRISDCRRQAEERGLDSHVWENVSPFLNSAETASYISSVREYYEAFLRICPGRK